MGATGADGGAGVGATGGGGEGVGGSDCTNCAEYFTDCLAGSEPYCEGDITFCDGSEAILSAFETCACTACATDCELSCTGSGEDTVDCGTCLGAAAGNGGECEPESMTCVNDV
ncbi:MAG: hypothetical protein WKG00_01660 [Polyangiaceae bacterium]